MSQPRLPGCTGKRKFATAELAVQINTGIRERRLAKKLHPYRCDHCGCWHASSLTPEQNAAMLARLEQSKRRAARRFTPRVPR